MITLSAAAAEQIRNSAKIGKMEGLPLRVAIKKNEDGSLHYAMGFDDRAHDDDIELESEGVKLVTNAVSVTLGKGMQIDYVELAEGEFNFIFKNPNDPNYSPPKTEE